MNLPRFRPGRKVGGAKDRAVPQSRKFVSALLEDGVESLPSAAEDLPAPRAVPIMKTCRFCGKSYARRKWETVRRAWCYSPDCELKHEAEIG
jgi:hypothetical protein